MLLKDLQFPVLEFFWTARGDPSPSVLFTPEELEYGTRMKHDIMKGTILIGTDGVGARIDSMQPIKKAGWGWFAPFPYRRYQFSIVLSEPFAVSMEGIRKWMLMAIDACPDLWSEGEEPDLDVLRQKVRDAPDVNAIQWIVAPGLMGEAK